MANRDIKKRTSREFFKIAEEIHGDEFDYSNTDYTDSVTRIKIIHKKCGKEVFVYPHDHISKKRRSGCKFCKREEVAKKQRKTFFEFVDSAQKIHGNKYDYSLVDYKNNKTKIKIFCNICKNIFEQTPQNHAGKSRKYKTGCPKCAARKKSLDNRLGNKRFINKAKSIHGDNFNYSLINYKNNRVKIDIICNECLTVFSQIPLNHISKYNTNGCPDCYSSTREKIIMNWLDRNKIRYKKEKTFDTCKNPETNYKLRFDFYLEDFGVLLEHHGKQHFKLVKHFSKTKKGLEELQKRDLIKKNWAKENGFKYFMIAYDEDIIKRMEEIIEI